jgi:lysophospholipase L1-like esterase
MNANKTISIIGDSILRGVVFDEIAKKYKFLQKSAANLFAKSNKIEIQNLSRFGQTTVNVLTKLPSMLETNSDWFLIELGGNDCDQNWEQVIEKPSEVHEANVPLAKFKENIIQIIDKIRGVGKVPVIMTLPPIDSDKYFKWIVNGDDTRASNLMKWLGDKNLIYRTQENYATALERIAVTCGVATVPLREKLLGIHKYSDYMCIDGIHLNEQGQEFVKRVCDERYREYSRI